MSEIKELPAVGRSFTTPCKKCAEDRMHRVLAHSEDKKSAKIECEICKKKSTYKLAAEKKPKVPKKPKAPAAPKGPGFEELRAKNASKPKPYRISEKFEKDAAVEHPKFGVGYVVNVGDQRIEVVFEDATRVLVHAMG